MKTSEIIILFILLILSLCVIYLMYVNFTQYITVTKDTISFRSEDDKTSTYTTKSVLKALDTVLQV